MQQSDYTMPDRRDKYSQRGVMVLTPEEMQTWRECMKKSHPFFAAIIGGIAGYGLMKISRFDKYAIHGMVAGSIANLMLNRWAVSLKCLNQSVPLSTIKDRWQSAAYDRNQSVSLRQYQNLQLPKATSDSEEPSKEIVFDDYLPMNSYDTYSSLNDSSDILISEDTDLSEPINIQKNVTYDELRQKNREEYYKKQISGSTPKTFERPNVSTASQMYQQTPADRTPSMQEKTKYGDMWG